MTADLDKMTKKVRVILHLSRYSKFQSDKVCPVEMTQRGIADVLEIKREHVTMVLKRLKEKGIVESRTAHVAKSGVNRKVYNLTWSGEILARQLKERTGAAGEAWSEKINGFAETIRRSPHGPEVADTQVAPRPDSLDDTLRL